MKRILSLLILVLLLLSGAVHAQDNQPPLLILKFGDNFLYQYQNSELTPLSFCAPDSESLQVMTVWVSPDGFQYAFVTNGSRAGNANNLRVCDLKAQRLINVTGPSQARDIHSAPTWSPDGTKLAFARLLPEQNHLELIIYDLASNNRQVVYTRDFGVSASSLPPQVVWGAAGIAMFNTNAVGQASPTAGSEYVFYPAEYIGQDKKGDAIVRHLADYYDTLQIVTGDEPTTESFVVSSFGNPDKLLDIPTNEVSDLPSGSVVKINPLAPHAGFATQTGTSFGSQWVIGGADYSTLLNTAAPTSDTLAISPDGKQFAFVTFENYPYGGKVYVLTDPAAFMASTGQAKLSGIISIPELNGFYGEVGAIAVFWGPSVMALRP